MLLLYFPARQVSQPEPEPVEYLPGPQSEHDESPGAAPAPAAQLSQAVLAPEGMFPYEHVKHASRPEVGEYSPTLQTSQEVAPTEATCFPLGQAEQIPPTNSLYRPTGQASQSEIAVEPDAIVVFPAVQAIHWAAASTPLYFPSVHGMQENASSDSPSPTPHVEVERQPVLSDLAKLSPEHDVQEVEPYAEEKEAPWQALQGVPNVGLNSPGAHGRHVLSSVLSSYPSSAQVVQDV